MLSLPQAFAHVLISLFVNCASHSTGQDHELGIEAMHLQCIRYLTISVHLFSNGLCLLCNQLPESIFSSALSLWIQRQLSTWISSWRFAKVDTSWPSTLVTFSGCLLLRASYVSYVLTSEWVISTSMMSRVSVDSVKACCQPAGSFLTVQPVHKVNLFKLLGLLA